MDTNQTFKPLTNIQTKVLRLNIVMMIMMAMVSCVSFVWMMIGFMQNDFLFFIICNYTTAATLDNLRTSYGYHKKYYGMIRG